MRLSRIKYRKQLLVIIAAFMLIIVSFSFPVAAQTPTPSSSASATASPATSAPTQTQFHDAIRKLWEDHIFWTHLVVVSLMGGYSDTNIDINRLLQNQVDIGNVFKPFYGSNVGDQLTALLQTHIKTAGAVLTDLKANDTAKYNTDNAQWYSNANDIAAFWNKINSQNWPLDTAQNLMKVHLDQILADANARLKQDWAGDVTAFDAMNDHILMMADFLSNGIVAQFPTKFTGSINSDLYSTPTASPSLSPSSSPLPSPSPTPIATPTPAPTATPAPSGAPSISILQPAINTYLVGSEDINVVVQVSNFNLADKTGQSNVPGEGHLIYYLNVQPPTTTGQPALTASGTYAVSASTSYQWKGLAEGVYTFSVQLVNNDNTPLVPPVVATSTNTVYPG